MQLSINSYGTFSGKEKSLIRLTLVDEINPLENITFLVITSFSNQEVSQNTLEKPCTVYKNNEHQKLAWSGQA